MSKLPPEWAMAGQALHSAGDPHLRSGVHLRLTTSPKLGLPLRPLSVYKTTYSPISGPPLRSDITWADSHGRVLAVPFTLRQGMEVYGHLPVGSTTRCIWFRVLATLQATDSLRVEALRNTELGPAVLAARDRAPFDIGSSYTQLIRVTGSGTITGVQWMDGNGIRIEIGRTTPSFFLGLPVERAARYEGLADAKRLSEDRVRFGAPQRMGLHDEPSKPDPGSCTPIVNEEDLNRVNSLTPGLWPLLDQLLNDLSAQQQDLMQPYGLTSGLPASTPGEALLNCLGTVLGAALDPGLGRWLGFMDTDFQVTTNQVVIYLIRGYWAIDPLRLEPTHELPLLEAVPDARVPLLAPRDETLPYSVPTRTIDRPTQIYEFHLPVVTTVGAPPLPPGPPDLGPARNGEGPWQPLTPPLAQRELIVPVRRVWPGACMAFARREGLGYKSLNGQTPNGRAAALLVAQAEDAEQPQTGELFDREALETSVEYRVAQADWFGRWSGWSTLVAAPASRPLPPKPVLEAWYEKPALPSPMHSQPLWGRLTVKVPVPPVDNLAPGSHLLSRLRIVGDIQGSPVTLEVAVPAASFVEVEVPCPTSSGQPLYIGRCQSVQARLRAQWRNTAGQTGPLSEERTLLLVDPRPPERVAMDPSLRYSARPDATGHARVTLTWPVQGQQRRYRVYVCDETRLVSAMEKRVAAGGATAAQGFLTAWNAATTPAQRAAAFTDRASLFGRELFENLTGEALEVSGGATTMQYQQELSGSLKVLTLYRVVSLSESNVESPFLDSPLVPFGVPNSGPPPRPLLELVPESEIPPGSPLPAGTLRLRVQVIRGAQPATRYRLRRSSVSGDDALRMPVAREAVVPLPAGWESREGAVTFEIDDTGAYVHEPGTVLRPWTRYYWRVELQAPSEPGSTVPGQWSLPSAAVSGMIVPAPPQAPTLLALNAVREGQQVRWTHSEPLTGGTMGRYRFDVYRRTPGGREERIGSVVPDAPATEGGRDNLGQFFFIDTAPVSGSTYRVVVYDPIGRMSPPSAAMPLP